MAERVVSPVFSLQFNKARLAKGKTFAEVARGAGVSENHIGDLSRGERRPSPEMLAKISQAMQLEPWERLRLHRAAAIDAGFEIGGLDA